MRVSVIRDPSLTSLERRAVIHARLGPLLRESGDRLRVPSRAGLSLRLTNDAELRDLNARFLGIDAPTDVLAFPADERDRVGDVAISVEHALGQSSDGAAELRLPAARMTAMTRVLLPGADVPELETADV
jgi:ssRNA-specific RNase YbeY (16S rRNA maturation enzyme)